MNISHKIRNFVFWTLDSLKGNPIKKHLDEVNVIQENFNSKRAIHLRKTNLQNLLEHARLTTPFYISFNSSNLEDYPVIDKNVIRKNKKEFISDKLKNKNNKSVSTSGSSGITLQVFQDRNKVLRSTAENIYFYDQVGFKVGYRLFYFRIWWGNVSTFLMNLKNIIFYEVRSFNDKGYMEHLIKTIESYHRESGIIGYASAFEQICQHLDKKKSKPIDSNKVKAIIAISEPLFSHTKTRMSHYFNSNVYSRYSNSENGILAQQTLNSKEMFVMNWSGYFFEILNLENNLPAKPGCLGRIVVTDLFNYAMPIIRYDTGDVGIVDFSYSPPILKKVEGRKSDMIYNTKGETVSPMIIVRTCLSEGVIQSQLIQEEKKLYILKLKVTQLFKEENLIISEFKNILGNDAIINVVYVNDIPVLSSGKRRATMNKFKL